MTTKYEDPACAYCPPTVRACRQGESAQRGPGFCPTKLDPDVQAHARAEYRQDETHRVSREAALVESEGYCRWTRVEEIVQFAKKMGFRKLGIANCISFVDHAHVLSGILESHGFEVVSVACKTGNIPKEEIGLADAQKIRPGQFEPLCNPVAQAELLNEHGCELNVGAGAVRRPRQPVLPPREGADHGTRRERPRAGPQPGGGAASRGHVLQQGVGTVQAGGGAQIAATRRRRRLTGARPGATAPGP
jgi:uncharacterized metal-binding protein